MASAIARGIRFNYLVLGQGSPRLVGLHGLLLDNLSSFYLTIGPALSSHGSLLLFDQRGHGRTEQPDDGYDTVNLASDAKALVEATGFSDDGVIIVGHSFGGLVALQYAVLFPNDVKGLVLIEAHTGTPEFGKRMAETLSSPEEHQAKMIQDLFGSWASLQGQLGRQEDIQTTEGKLHRIRSRKRSPIGETATRLVKHTTLIRDMASTPPIDPYALRQITCPTLAIYGDASDILSEGQRLARLMPDCSLEVIPNCGHGVIWQERPALMQALTTWLRRFGGTN